ncbi:MAG: translation elongation factor Ts [Acholeplasmataceae bacterium]|nr:translation elongation factor Ts [Acholeplasmataceae bacterium]
MAIEKIKRLREQTGAGFLDVKQALEKHHGDEEKALAFLRSQLSKETENIRVASKGAIEIVVKDNQAVIFEVIAETDFITKNEHYQNLLKIIGETIHNLKIRSTEEALATHIQEKSIEEHIRYVGGLVKENVSLRRYLRIYKQSEDVFGFYKHPNGKYVSLVILNNGTEEDARKLALQIVANDIKWMRVEDIDPIIIEAEKARFYKINIGANEANFNNHLRSLALLSQILLGNETKTVEKYLLENQMEVIDFYRLELGEDIENKLNCRIDFN